MAPPRAQTSHSQRPGARKRVFIPGYRGCVQHMQETMFGTFANCTAQAYQAARHGTGPSRLKPLYPTADEYYYRNPDARFKTNKGNQSHISLGDERDWRMTSNNMEMIRVASEPPPRHEPLVDGFEEMSFEGKDEVYTKALLRAGRTGVKNLEKSIRDKISQRTSGGPFALRKAFKYFDRDGSGSIDPDEFYAAMDFFGLQFTEDQVLGLFGTYDDDRSGSLEYYEFVEKLLDEGVSAAKSELKGALSDLYGVGPPPSADVSMSLKESRRASIGSVKKMFNKFDINGSGQIDARELRFLLEKLGLMASTDMVSSVMEALDSSGNGEIEWEEFWDWWQKKHQGSPGSPGTRPGTRSISRPGTSSPSPSPPANAQQPNSRSVTPEVWSRQKNAENSRGATPSPEVQQMRGAARFNRPSAPSRDPRLVSNNAGSLDFPERPLPSRGSLVSRGSSLSVGPKWCDPPGGGGRPRSRGLVSQGGFRSRTPTANPGPRISFAPPPGANGFLPNQLGNQIQMDAPRVQTAGMFNLTEKMHASGRSSTGFRIGGGLRIGGGGEN